MITPPDADRHPARRAPLEVWERHTYAEFVAKDVEAALATMTEDTHVLLLPPLAGGAGKDGVRSSTTPPPRVRRCAGPSRASRTWRWRGRRATAWRRPTARSRSRPMW